MKKNKGVVVAAVAGPAAGPGWANQPLRVYVNDCGTITEHYIQSDEHTAVMATLYGISANVNTQMCREAAHILGMRTKD